MPTYDYRCDACGHEFEHFQAISDALLKKCPRCGKRKLKRLIGAGGGLLFKGSGFYITDYRSPNYSEAAKKDAPATEKSAPAAGSTDGAAKPPASGDSPGKPAPERSGTAGGKSPKGPRSKRH